LDKSDSIRKSINEGELESEESEEEVDNYFGAPMDKQVAHDF